MPRKGIILVLIWIVLAVIPMFSSDFIIHMLILTLMYAYSSQAWNILSGYSGYFSFGHAAFFGIGAYVSSTFLTKFAISPWIGMLAGVLIAGLAGLIIGFLTFRYKLKGVYFALATLAFAEIFRQIVENMSYFNKTSGILIPLEIDATMYQFSSRSVYYYIIFILMTLITLLVYKISKSKLGYNLVAIRENEEAAKSLGVESYKNKMIAVCFSGGLTALAGTFYAQYLLMAKPSAVFDSDMSINILLPSIIGGAGTVLGPIVGAFVIIPLGELMNGIFSETPGVQFIVYGAIIITVIMFLPEGIVGFFKNRSNKKNLKRKVSNNITERDSVKEGVENDDSYN